LIRRKKRWQDREAEAAEAAASVEAAVAAAASAEVDSEDLAEADFTVVREALGCTAGAGARDVITDMVEAADASVF
jgi:hypothetical protein